MNSVYILKGITPESDPEFDGICFQNVNNGEIGVDVDFLGVFDEVAKAEKTILAAVASRRETISKHPDWGVLNYACFYLTEHALDDGLDSNGEACKFESIRTYDGRTGKLHCFSDLDERCKKKFVGRDSQPVGVEAGTFCWTIDEYRIVPVYLDRLAMTTAEVKERFRDGFAGDFTDDSGLAFTIDSGHVHPQAHTMFPLDAIDGAAISEVQKGMMLKCRDLYYRCEAL